MLLHFFLVPMKNSGNLELGRVWNPPLQIYAKVYHSVLYQPITPKFVITRKKLVTPEKILHVVRIRCGCTCRCEFIRTEAELITEVQRRTL